MIGETLAKGRLRIATPPSVEGGGDSWGHLGEPTHRLSGQHPERRALAPPVPLKIAGRPSTGGPWFRTVIPAPGSTFWAVRRPQHAVAKGDDEVIFAI